MSSLSRVNSVSSLYGAGLPPSEKVFFLFYLYEHLSGFTQSVLQHMRLYVGNHRIEMEGLPENIEGWKTKTEECIHIY